MIASKLFVTRRERFDGADIAHVIYGTHGQLDWKRVLQLAGEHWELVLWSLILFHYVYPGNKGYVPQWLWADLLGRLENILNSADDRAEFRGSLIDDVMFAIDVEEWGLPNLMTGYRVRRQQIERPPGPRKS